MIIDATCTMDEVMELKAGADDELSRAVAAHAEVMNQFKAWLHARGGHAQYHDTIHYIGPTKTHQVHDNLALVEALLAETDVPGLAKCMSKNAWKIGECRKALATDDQVDGHFTTMYRRDAYGEIVRSAKQKPAAMAAEKETN